MSESSRALKVKAADVCRDGGSYIVVYVDATGRELELGANVICRNGERIGYEMPQVLDRARGELTILTWDDANELAREFCAAANAGIAWGGIKRLNECVAVLAAAGEVPDEA